MFGILMFLWGVFMRISAGVRLFLIGLFVVILLWSVFMSGALLACHRSEMKVVSPLDVFSVRCYADFFSCNDSIVPFNGTVFYEDYGVGYD